MSDKNAAVRQVLKSQYHASLAMLREAIERCPAGAWSSAEQKNVFWQVAYHTLFYTHFYLQADAASFRPWAQHQRGVQYLDGIGPPSAPDAVPRVPETYTQAAVLDYWSFCDAMIDEAVDALDLDSAESGFPWYRVSKLEHQMINLRHVQHHTAQLAERVRSAANVGIKWVGAGQPSARLD